MIYGMFARTSVLDAGHGAPREPAAAPRLLARGIAVGAMIALAACTPATKNDLAREAAKRTITPIIAAQFPGLDTEDAVNCAIDNASSREILTLAGGTVTGDTVGTTSLVAELMARPGTITCIAEKRAPGIGGILGRFS